MFPKTLRWAVAVCAFFAVASCGKDLSQIVAAPSVATRVADSLSGSVSVPTAMTPVSSTDFKFAVFGDVQVRAENVTRLAAFKTAALARGVEFFVVLGDLTEDATNAELTQIKAGLDGVGLPYYTTIGNHDLFQGGSAGGWPKWKTTFGAATYSVTIAGAVRLIFLDTASGDVGARQFQWLDGLLATSVPYTFVGSHYPIYDGFTPLMWRLSSVEERYKLTSLLSQRSVYALIAGHVHGYRQTTVGGVQHFTVGSMYPYELDFGSAGFVMFHYLNGAMSSEWVGL